jgi:hypothetical protein
VVPDAIRRLAEDWTAKLGWITEPNSGPAVVVMPVRQAVSAHHAGCGWKFCRSNAEKGYPAASLRTTADVTQPS